MTIFGAPPTSALFCERKEFRRLPDGGGDFSLGLRGHEGVVLSPGVALLDPLAGRGTRDAGCSEGGN
jgi:hypothetical protein